MITITTFNICTCIGLTIGLLYARLHLSVEFIGVVLAKLRCSLFSPCIPLTNAIAYGWGFVVKDAVPVGVK